MWRLKIGEGADSPCICPAQTTFWGGRHGSLVLMQILFKSELRLKRLAKISTKTDFRSSLVAISSGKLQVMCLYITGHLSVVFSVEHRKEIKRYIYNHQNKDGGWGITHREPQQHVLYGLQLSLRLLGEGPDGGEDNAMARGRKWILDHGGVTNILSWGKAWLSIFGVYDWSGCNPILPEFLLFYPYIQPTYRFLQGLDSRSFH